MHLIIGLSSINKIKDTEVKTKLTVKGEERECQREKSNGSTIKKDTDLSRGIMGTIFLSITVPYRQGDSELSTKVSE
jgi:hypothetical protein